MRLRQTVLVVEDMEPLAAAFCGILGTQVSFRDPHIAEFGAENVMLPVGDTFLELITPLHDDSAAARYLRRNGDGGYMALVQVDDVEAARRRVTEAGMRTIYESRRETMRGFHIHPKDVGGAILALDEAHPPESWAFAGPWEGVEQTGAVSEITAIELAVPEPDVTAANWETALGRARTVVGGTVIALDRGEVRFVRGTHDSIVTVDLAAPRPAEVLTAAEAHGAEVDHDRFALAGVHFRVRTP